jgi:8-oxo-dGTP diphosphatase
MLNVTYAIILINNKVLVTQKSEKVRHLLKWEFPRGKLEILKIEIDCINWEIKKSL